MKQGTRKQRAVAIATLIGLLTTAQWNVTTVAAAGKSDSVTVETVCPDTDPTKAHCLALRRTDLVSPASGVTPASTGAYGPSDLASAYKLPGGSAGTGMTVAIVDAFDAPSAESDLATYRSFYGLPDCTTANGCFHKVGQDGGSTLPAADTGWAQEISLDLAMVSAVCPNCHIILVEATSANLTDLGTAVNTAVSMGAVAVSNSWGARENVGQTLLDSTYFNHPGVVITASTGDCGWNCSGYWHGTDVASTEYPATSPYVVSVGGTSLSTAANARGWTETAWGNTHGGAGSGCSIVEPKPTWQPTSVCGSYRSSADVSAVADPATGVAIVYSGGWYVFGGTSAAAPIIAATYALAGQPGNADYPASYLYHNTSALFDVVGGNNDVTWGNCTTGSLICNAVAGYDGPTGLGTPNGLTAFRSAVTGGTYHAMTPTRILDSRDGTGGYATPFRSHQARGFTVRGAGGVPASAAVTAVTGNLTVTQQSSLGFLYIGPSAMNDPTSSTLNFPKADDRANAVTVALSSDGKLYVTYAAPVRNTPTAHIIFDVTGYFTADTSGSTYHPLAPTRLLDTRDGTGGIATPLKSHHAQSFTVRGAGGVPASATVTAVTGNLTVTQQSSLGFLYIGPNQADDPTSSNLNFPKADDRANAVTVALSADGKLFVTYAAPVHDTPVAHVIFDVTGYFTADATGAKYVALNPARILDTRDGTGGPGGALRSHQGRTFPLVGSGGIPASATAVTGNLTVTQQSSLGFLYVGPVKVDDPTSSNLNFPKADDRANAVTVALSGDGKLSVTYAAPIHDSPTTHAIFDVTGYFTP